MDLLFPITTIAVIAIGAFSLFIAIDNHSRAFPKTSTPVENNRQMFSMITQQKVEKARK